MFFKSFSSKKLPRVAKQSFCAKLMTQEWRATVAQVEALLECYFGVLEDLLGSAYSPQTITRAEHFEMLVFDIEEDFGIILEEARVPMLVARLQERFAVLQARVDADPRPAAEVLNEFEFRYWRKYTFFQNLYGHFLARVQG